MTTEKLVTAFRIIKGGSATRLEDRAADSFELIEAEGGDIISAEYHTVAGIYSLGVLFTVPRKARKDLFAQIREICSKA